MSNARLKALVDVHRAIVEYASLESGSSPSRGSVTPTEPRVAPAKGTIRNLQGDDLLSALELWANLGHRAEGHWLTVSVSYTIEGAPCASITWETGTRQPSTFLGGVLGGLLDQMEGP